MLKIEVQGGELFDPVTETFVYSKGGVLVLEHSLASLSKWESKWKVPFLHCQQMTSEQTLDYIKCMTVTQNVDPNTYLYLSNDQMKQILDYISDPMTATTINEAKLKKHGGGGQLVTSELIYYWMTALNIPFECQKWHLNRLLTLIKVAAIEQDGPQKMNQHEAMAQQHALNMMRRAKFKSKG